MQFCSECSFVHNVLLFTMYRGEELSADSDGEEGEGEGRYMVDFTRKIAEEVCVSVCMCVCVYVCVCSIFPLSLQLATGARDTDINPDKEKTDEVFSSPSRPERISFQPMRFVGLCVLRVGRRGCGVLLLNTRRWWTTGWTGRPAR